MAPSVTVRYSDGNIFVGTLIDNKKNGYGIFYWANGTRYEGCWKDGVMCGVGKLYREDIETVGEWKDN